MKRYKLRYYKGFVYRYAQYKNQECSINLQHYFSINGSPIRYDYFFSFKVCKENVLNLCLVVKSGRVNYVTESRELGIILALKIHDARVIFNVCVRGMSCEHNTTVQATIKTGGSGISSIVH